MSIRTPELADTIISGIEKGIPLRQLCRTHGISKSEWYRWLDDDADLQGRFARAREIGQEEIFEETLEIADDSSNDYVDRETKSGTMRVLDDEHVQRSKLRIWTRLQLLAKWNPKKYGEKVAVTDGDGNPLQPSVVVYLPDNGRDKTPAG